MTATIGGRGQILYAAANRMLDAMAHRLRAEGLNCVAVQWGQWTTLDIDPPGERSWPLQVCCRWHLPMR